MAEPSIRYALSDSIDTVSCVSEDSFPLELPLYISDISAGFPSPATDYLQDSLDLNSWMVANPSATFFVRVAGDSMKGASILEGDYLVVDRSLQARHQDIVIAAVDGELTVKRLYRQNQVIQLQAENGAYPPINFKGDMELMIFGVVVGVIRKTR